MSLDDIGQNKPEPVPEANSLDCSHRSQGPSFGSRNPLPKMNVSFRIFFSQFFTNPINKMLICPQLNWAQSPMEEVSSHWSPPMTVQDEISEEEQVNLEYI